MVNLKFFLIEEGFSTFRTTAFLPLGELLFGEREIFGFRRLPLLPVVLKARVIGRGLAFDERVTFNGEPAKFKQMCPCLFVSKHPGVHSV